MLYARSAELVAISHAAFIAFLLVGGYAAWRFPRLVWVHIPAVVLTAAIFAFGADCPLTDLEKYLRHQAGEPAYRGGFIAHYLLSMVPDGARAVAVPVVVVLVTAAAYTGYIGRRRRAGTEPKLTNANRADPGPTVSAHSTSMPSHRWRPATRGRHPGITRNANLASAATSSTPSGYFGSIRC
jgi:hypothetical protein